MYVPISFDGGSVLGKSSFITTEEWNKTSSVGGHNKVQLLSVTTA